ncbi:hypothetical protein AOP6_0203 [Desulfuromonas sp. AOP6]|nr:hypothetical protein AOP6_0203 [Desulfuromonas sp. AOP6]
MDYQATEKLRMNASAIFNLAKDSWDWRFSERATLSPEYNPDLVLADTGIETPGAYASVNYDTWELNNLITSYSDLEYTQYEFTLGGTYAFTDRLYTTASVTYEIFESDQMYVYGNEDGDVFRGYLALGYKF